MENSLLRVSNVKAHFRVTPSVKVPNALQQCVTTYNNFWTFRPPLAHIPVLLITGNCKLVYVVFPRSGHVNVSGIKAFSQCNLAQETFTDLFQVSIIMPIAADNSTVTGRLPLQKEENLHLAKLPALLPKLLLRSSSPIHPCTVSIRPHYFPSALLRPKKQSKHLISTIILFTNGKFIIIGSKNLAQATRTLHNLQQIVHEHNITDINSCYSDSDSSCEE